MPKVMRVKPHLSPDEISAQVKKETDYRRIRRWYILLNLLDEPTSAKIMARRFRVSEDTVQKVVEKYNREGPAAFKIANKTAIKGFFLSSHEEELFIKNMRNKRSQNSNLTVKDIKQHLEVFLNHSVSPSTVYRLLRRNNWWSKKIKGI